MRHCPSCTSDDLVHIDLAPGGRKMNFNTCRSCEHKWWIDSEIAVEVGLNTVLHQVAMA